VAFGARTWLHRLPPPPETPVAIHAPKPPPVVVPKPEEPKRVEEPRRHVAHVAAPAAAKKVEAPAQKRVVDLAPQPKAVRVILDGKLLGDFGPELTRLELEPGEHTFTFESDACFPESVKVRPDQSGHISARLRWKPASITVMTKPESAAIVVDGNMVIKSGQSLPRTIDPQENSRDVTVKVTADGFESQELHFKLHGGEHKKVDVELKARAE
jgi:hypothetical protein